MCNLGIIVSTLYTLEKWINTKVVNDIPAKKNLILSWQKMVLIVVGYMLMMAGKAEYLLNQNDEHHILQVKQVVNHNIFSKFQCCFTRMTFMYIA